MDLANPVFDKRNASLEEASFGLQDKRLTEQQCARQEPCNEVEESILLTQDHFVCKIDNAKPHGSFRLAVGRVSLVHTLCYCQHRARGRRARLDAGGQRMPCKFSSPSHPVLLSAQGPGGAEHVEVQEAGGGAPLVA